MNIFYSILGVACLIAVSSAKDFRVSGVNQHNVYRPKHHSPKIRSDKTVDSSAQKWANELAASGDFKHSGNPKYGENIYKAWGESKDLSSFVNDAVEDWYSEVKDYDYDNPGFSMATGHFTQVVWKGSTKVGIGAAKGKDGSVVVVAQYSPPGNYEGQFPENVLRP